MQAEKVNSAIRMLSKQTASGVLELNKETMTHIHAKLSKSEKANPDTLLHYPSQPTNSIIYEDIVGGSMRT